MSDTRASHDGSLLCSNSAPHRNHVYIHIIMLLYSANRRRRAVVHGDFTGQ